MYIYGVQGELVHLSETKGAIIENYVDISQMDGHIDMSQLTDVTTSMVGRTIAFATFVDGLYFQDWTYKDYKGDFTYVLSENINQDYLQGFVTITSTNTVPGVVFLTVGWTQQDSPESRLWSDGKSMNLTSAFNSNDQISQLSFWKIYRHRLTGNYYFNHAVSNLFMYSDGGGGIKFTSIPSEQVAIYGGFTIVAERKRDSNGYIVFEYTKDKQPKRAAAPQTASSTAALRSQITAAKPAAPAVRPSPPPAAPAAPQDITATLIGKAIVFKDVREGKFFQAGQFGVGTPILGTSKTPVSIVASKNDTVQLVVNNNEFIGNDGSYAIKTRTADPGCNWRVIRRPNNKLYLFNPFKGKFMYAAGNGVVSMDTAESVNVAKFGTFDIVP